ncbi:hypothetical protein [Paraburkholderia sp.]|uniref:hypothetical protein n=1 Tax=Paraburkholderia sp. TaxID=1926495 RepID=UPI0026262FE2|nr:hypothetical protein [Paraburkholderia sp.]
MEQELRHLECVFGHLTAANTVPSLTYWRSRLNSLRQASIAPQQRNRIGRLEQQLLKLEAPKRETAGAASQETRTNPPQRTPR